MRAVELAVYADALEELQGWVEGELEAVSVA